MFCSKHVDVKRHSVYFPEIRKTFAVSSSVLNLIASQIGDFFLPHSVYVCVCVCVCVCVHTDTYVLMWWKEKSVRTGQYFASLYMGVKMGCKVQDNSERAF